MVGNPLLSAFFVRSGGTSIGHLECSGQCGQGEYMKESYKFRTLVFIVFCTAG